MRARLIMILAAWFACLALACSGDDGAEPQPPTATPPLPPTEVPTPPPTATPMPFMRVPLTVWLYDAEEGDLLTLLEDYERSGWEAYFGATQTTVVLEGDDDGRRSVRHFDLDGSEAALSATTTRCEYSTLEIGGQPHRDVACTGSFFRRDAYPDISPDGRWFTYSVMERETDDLATYSRWLLNLQTGERRVLQSDLQDCRACITGPGWGWSPSGRYLFFQETGPGQRVFLSDMVAGWTNDITTATTAFRLGPPEWSPAGDVLLRRSIEGTALLHDVASGTVTELSNAPWPARFDSTGRYVYMPLYGADRQGLSIRVIDLTRREPPAIIQGSAPPSGLWGVRPPAVVGTDNGFVAAVEYAPECDGTAIYTGSRLAGCVSGGFGSVISPGGAYVALARITGFSGEVEFPGGGTTGVPLHEIVIFEIAGSKEGVVAEAAVSDEPPRFTWNDEGTHLLILWPFQGNGP